MNVRVTVRGDVAQTDQTSVRAKVEALDRIVRGDAILDAHVVLTQERNPRLPLPARAEGEVFFKGHAVRVHVAAPVMSVAVDDLAERLHVQLRRHVEKLVTRHRVPADGAAEWRHGAWSPPRPPVFPRPPAEREVVRRHSFVAGPITLAEAALDLDALQDEFLLFTDADTGAEAVLHRGEDGLCVIDPQGVERVRGDEHEPRPQPSRFSGPITVDQARAEMDAVEHRFVFFVDAATERGCVLYRRRDGHYGLVEAT